MRCTETQVPVPVRAWLVLACVAGLLLSSCSSRAPDREPAAAPAPVVSITPGSAPPPAPAPPRAANPPQAAAGPGAPAPQAAPRPKLGQPNASRSWEEFRLQAARRLVAANPAITYVGPVPEPLLAIPVLEVELNADGSVKRVHVLRHPSQARDTTQMAIDAVHRAAPYGDVSRLPKPWKWAEVFLFDDDRRFKPRTLDL